MSSSHTIGRSADDGPTRIEQLPIVPEPSMMNARLSRLPLVHWLLTTELGDAEGPVAERAATGRVFHKLDQRLGQLIAPVGSEALLTRAVHLSRTEFPFLDGVQATPNTASVIGRRLETAANAEPSQAQAGCVSVLGTMVSLLESLIGEDLTFRLLRDVWPELPTILRIPDFPHMPGGRNGTLEAKP